jgi:hypothetical protein
MKPRRLRSVQLHAIIGGANTSDFREAWSNIEDRRTDWDRFVDNTPWARSVVGSVNDATRWVSDQWEGVQDALFPETALERALTEEVNGQLEFGAPVHWDGPLPELSADQRSPGDLSAQAGLDDLPSE